MEEKIRIIIEKLKEEIEKAERLNVRTAPDSFREEMSGYRRGLSYAKGLLENMQK